MKRHPRFFAGAGVLCFVAVLLLWLASSGDRASADKDNEAVISQSLTRSIDTAVAIDGPTRSKVTISAPEGVVQRVSVYIDVRGGDALRLKVWLTSPAGTRVLLVDGAGSDAPRGRRLEGWFGADGLPSVQSLDAFAGEPASGDWLLTLDGRGELTRWSITTDLGANVKLAGMETYGEYPPNEVDCDCRLAASDATQGLMTGLLVLGLALLRCCH